MQYAVIFEKCKHNYSAYVPDLPGCIAIGETFQETRERITEAIEFQTPKHPGINSVYSCRYNDL